MKNLLLFISVILFAHKMQATHYLAAFQSIPDKHLEIDGVQMIFPKEYQLSKLDLTGFKALQRHIFEDENANNVIIELPTPDGGMMKFRVYENPMMEKPLADKYSMIKTYTAIHTENPWITAKLDFTVWGFHAMIFNGDDTYFIDPYKLGNTEWYLVYYKHQFSKPINDYMHCELDESHIEQPAQSAINLSGNGVTPLAYKTNGSLKKTYRLALACTVEYSNAVVPGNPTKAGVLSAMVTSMNRVNGVFEREFSMHANLIANNDTLIFIGTASSDPYSNTSGSTMLGQNQTTVNTRIGSANYDFGHVFSTGGGGIASLGCVCNSSTKAQGVTGSPNPVGDPFDIDYVAHEMGHQFGGQHTFNSQTGSCSGNRSSQSAYEPGSGTTIMAYAGICGSDNIQSNSNDYYHLRSLDQMTGSSVGACAATVASNNSIPSLAPISSTYIIPYRTSFELTASATDSDGDPITYSWEEFDRGGSGGAWNAPTTVAPILRSFSPSTNPTRVFPTHNKLIQNVESYLGERLPDTNRFVRFKVTARDIKNGYGAFNYSEDTLRLDVRKTSSLFRVNSQSTSGQVWTGWNNYTITWDVAGTNAAPFNIANVDIYMSLDSGKTWTETLKLNTPNDGSETIVAPNQTSNWARVKVKANGSVFFDLNDQWIKLEAVTAPASLNQVEEMQTSIYPNPTSDFVTIKNENQEAITKYALYSLQGQLLVEQFPNSKECTIDLTHLPKGMYLLEVQSDTKQARKRLIKK